MAVTTVVQILSGVDLVPHIEERAYRFAMRQFGMARRVMTVSDMIGWNTRKVSLYGKMRSAQSLSEATDIPSTKLNRARLASIDPLEWGDRYPISDRRSETDPEAVLADALQFLGYSLGVNREQLIISELLDLYSTAYGSTSTDFTIDLPVALAFEFRKEFGGVDGTNMLHVAMHPYQARKVMADLIAFQGSTAAQPLDFVNQAIAGWRVPQFANMELFVSDWLPRLIVHKFAIDATGGTFKLEIGTKKEAGVNQTADISWNVTPATMASNIQTALNALTGQSGWTVTGSANNDLTVTAGSYLDAESELRVATDEDGDAINALTGTGTIVIQERSASALSPVWQSDALILDIRKGVTGFQELVNQGRVLELSAYEVFGVGPWRSDRIKFIQTDASSVLAV